MARINGTDLIITLARDGYTEQPLAHTTSASLSLEVASIDISSKDSSGNQEVIGGQKTATLDFEGLTDFASSGYGIDDLFALVDNRYKIDWTMGTESGGDATAPKFSGEGFITSLTLDAPMEDATTYSGTITVTGGVTFTAS